MYILLFFVLFNSQNYSKVIVGNVSDIIDYYETDENIKHQSIQLYSILTQDEFDSTLLAIRGNFPDIDIGYSELITEGESKCRISTCDLSIIIPGELINEIDGKFKYTFQSRIKNIFGQLEVEIRDGIFLEEKNQFIITSIGG